MFSPALPDNCEFVVNFDHELIEVSAEAKYLKKLGYAIPELAWSVALQENKFVSFQDSLSHWCHHAIAPVTTAEVFIQKF